MEQFDVVGLWRKREHSKPIETAGRMHDGKPFKDFAGMKQHLLEHRDKMVESILPSVFLRIHAAFLSKQRIAQHLNR